MSRIICPACKSVLEHERGYLPTHVVDRVRGELVTGSKVCELSNKKVLTEKESLHFIHECEDCGMTTEITITEDYPGAFETRKGFIEMDCIGCSTDHDGYYCENTGCGLEVKQTTATEWHVAAPLSKEVKVVYTEAEAEAELAKAELLLQDDEELPQIVEKPPGWYDLRGFGHCNGGDPITNFQHFGVFRPETHVKVLLVDDNNVITEEPDSNREDEEALING